LVIKVLLRPTPASLAKNKLRSPLEADHLNHDTQSAVPAKTLLLLHFFIHLGFLHPLEVDHLNHGAQSAVPTMIFRHKISMNLPRPSLVISKRLLSPLRIWLSSKSSIPLWRKNKCGCA